jgi:hypothetical protein
MARLGPSDKHHKHTLLTKRRNWSALFTASFDILTKTRPCSRTLVRRSATASGMSSPRLPSTSIGFLMVSRDSS